MIKTFLKLYKQVRISSYRSQCITKTNSPFIGVTEHPVDIPNRKDVHDDFKEVGNVNEADIVKKFMLNNNHQVVQYDDENDEDEICNSDISIQNLHKDIEGIDLDELKNTPNNIFNLAPLIEKNVTLQNLLKFGVDLHQIERRRGANILVRLSWDTGVVPVISFLKSQAHFSDAHLANIFSHYPQIFRKPLISIEYLFDYLKSRDISPHDLAAMINDRPRILALDRDTAKEKLNKMRSLMKLKPSEINSVIVSQPDILTIDLSVLQDCVMRLTKGVGFNTDEMRTIILSTPKILLKRKDDVLKNFIFLHRTLNMSHVDIVNCAPALAFSPSALSERVKFLIFLNRYQTDPARELYTPIINIAKGTEKEFCEKVAHASVDKFRRFLRTL